MDFDNAATCVVLLPSYLLEDRRMYYQCRESRATFITSICRFILEIVS